MNGKETLKVLYAENKIEEAEYEVLKSIIPLRYKESESFKSELVRSAFLLGRFMTVSDLNCKETDIYCNSHGKPFCKDKDYFNVSHTKDYIVYVKSDGKIGIDIEKLDKRILEIIDYAYTESEKEYIRSTSAESEIIYRATLLWTMKESVFKASGIERGLEPKDIETSDSGEVSFMGETYFIKRLDFNGNIVTVASEKEYSELQLVEFRI